MWQNVTATEKYVWENVLLYQLPVLKENLEAFQVKVRANRKCFTSHINEKKTFSKS